MVKGDRKVGPEETLWGEVLTRAGMSQDQQRPFLSLAKGRDLEIQRLQRGQQKIKESLDRLGDLLQEAIRLEQESR